MKNLRCIAYNLLENDDYDSLVKKVVEYFLIALILTNIIAVIASSVDSIYYKHKIFFVVFENISITIFSIEYLLRLWCIVEKDTDNVVKQRWQWVKSPDAVVDLIAIIPAFIMMFGLLDLRFVRIIRLLRLLKLVRYFTSLRTLLLVIQREKELFQAVLVILMILLVIASTGIYFAEHQKQPDDFKSIPHSMWWALVTLTTVGYGDMVPETPTGKIFGGAITVLGIGFAALPAGILASSLASELQQKRKIFEQEFRILLLDESMDPLEKKAKVRELRQELHLTKNIAKKIELEILRDIELMKREKELTKSNFCPHCGEPLD